MKITDLPMSPQAHERALRKYAKTVGRPLHLAYWPTMNCFEVSLGGYCATAGTRAEAQRILYETLEPSMVASRRALKEPTPPTPRTPRRPAAPRKPRVRREVPAPVEPRLTDLQQAVLDRVLAGERDSYALADELGTTKRAIVVAFNVMHRRGYFTRR